MWYFVCRALQHVGLTVLSVLTPPPQGDIDLSAVRWNGPAPDSSPQQDPHHLDGSGSTFGFECLGFSIEAHGGPRAGPYES